MEKLEKACQGVEDASEIDVKESLDDMDWRIVKTLYIDHADKMIEHIESHPLTALEFVIPRFKQKLKEWRNVYSEWWRLHLHVRGWICRGKLWVANWVRQQSKLRKWVLQSDWWQPHL